MPSPIFVRLATRLKCSCSERDEFVNVFRFLLYHQECFAVPKLEKEFLRRWRGGYPSGRYEAVRWFRLAAEQGFANAQNNLGLPDDEVVADKRGNPVLERRSFLLDCQLEERRGQATLSEAVGLS